MTSNLKSIERLPDWVPAAVRLYLAHTEGGHSLRSIARLEGLHASTVMRQVRRFENRRDDPLVDCALGRLRQAAHPSPPADDETSEMPPTVLDASVESVQPVPDETRLHAEALRVLRRMAEPGSIMAVAPDMDRAVVLRDGPEGAVRLAVLDRPLAEAFALREWIACRKPGRVSRYEITAAGRAELRRRMIEAGEEPAATSPQTGAVDRADAEAAEAEDAARPRYGLGESPVSVLARRRDRDGRPFLSADLVAAAERLREDFEISQCGPRITQDWERFLTGPGQGAGGSVPSGGRVQRGAQERVAAALRDLGPGLADMALRCCCLLEGLETAEQRLGWSARSGKIVLRIALMRLKRHYDALGDAGRMIG